MNHAYSQKELVLDVLFFEVGDLIFLVVVCVCVNFVIAEILCFGIFSLPVGKVNRRRGVSPRPSIDAVTSFLDVGVVYLCVLNFPSLYSFPLCTCTTPTTHKCTHEIWITTQNQSKQNGRRLKNKFKH